MAGSENTMRVARRATVLAILASAIGAAILVACQGTALPGAADDGTVDAASKHAQTPEGGGFVIETNDASATIDAARIVDAGDEQDAARIVDAGDEQDAEADAGAEPDAGADDAGDALDAGEGADAGDVPDASGDPTGL